MNRLEHPLDWPLLGWPRLAAFEVATEALSDYVQQTFAPSGSSSLKFRTEISRSTVIPSAQKQGKTVFQTEGTHKVANQYRELAAEVLERLFAIGSKLSTDSTPAPSDEVANG